MSSRKVQIQDKTQGNTMEGIVEEQTKLIVAKLYKKGIGKDEMTI